MDKTEVRSKQGNVRLVFSLSSCLFATKIWNEGVKGLKQQTCYGSITAEADRLNRHSQDMGAGQPQRSCHYNFSCFPLLYTSHLFLLFVPCAKQGLSPPPIKEENANEHMLKAI